MDSRMTSKKFWDDLEELVTHTLVPRFNVDAVRPCAAEDFQEYTAGLEVNLRNVASSLDDLLQNKDLWSTKTKNKLVGILAIIGEQHRKSAWNTCGAVELADQLGPKLCKIFKCENVTEVLRDDDTFVSVLVFLRPKLLKDTWKSYPSAVTCYKWLLETVEKPLLRRHVPDILPTALIILDDYVQENQAFGLDCISVIIEHCQNSKSLKNLNYDEVIYQALEKMMYKIEPSMIVPLYACIYKLLEYIEFCDDSNNIFGWTKRDNILSILLDNMELEGKIQSRYAYAVSLKKFMTRSAVGKWTERLARVLSEYCENISDIKTTNVSLDLLQMFLSIYQPYSINFYTAIYASLLKLNLELSSQKNMEELVRKSKECIILLNKQCPKLSEEISKNEVVQSVVNN